MYSVKYVFSANFATFPNSTNGKKKKALTVHPTCTFTQCKDGCFQSKTPFKICNNS